MINRIVLVGVILTQTAMPQPVSNILSRVLMVEVPSTRERGTVFSIDVDQREYWITAKHILNGTKHSPYGFIKNKTERLRILNPGRQGEQWLTIDFAVLDPGKDIDIAVLVPPHLVLTTPVPSMMTSSAGITMGGDCLFLGFPYGGGWRSGYSNGSESWMPFTKHCFVSGQMRPDQTTIWVLDGINNPGFSGGPVVHGNGDRQEIFAVVSGYVTEPTDVITVPEQKLTPPPPPAPKPKGTQAKPEAAVGRQTVNVNSGFILAFGINHAIDAIQKSPTGPLRNAK